MKTKHTRGKWWHDGRTGIYNSDNKRKVIAHAFEQHFRNEAVPIANAKLIAAAPELLESLDKTVKELRYALANHCDLLKIPKDTINNNSVVKMAESVIQKATL